MLLQKVHEQIAKRMSLIDGIDAAALLADKAYDVDYIIEKAKKLEVVIPPKKNRKEQRE